MPSIATGLEVCMIEHFGDDDQYYFDDRSLHDLPTLYESPFMALEFASGADFSLMRIAGLPTLHDSSFMTLLPVRLILA